MVFQLTLISYFIIEIGAGSCRICLAPIDGLPSCTSCFSFIYIVIREVLPHGSLI